MNNQIMNNQYTKIMLYSLIFSYLLEVGKNFSLNPMKIKVEQFVLQTLIISVLLYISKNYLPTLSSEGFQNSMLQAESSEQKMYKEITNMEELNDLYISKDNKTLIKENKLSDTDKLNIYKSLKSLCPHLIKNHKISDLSNLYKKLAGNTLENYQQYENTNEFVENCPVLVMTKIFGKDEATRIMNLGTEGFAEKCDTLKNDADTLKKLEKIYSLRNNDTKLLEEYSAGMFFIYKQKCLMDSQNDEQLYQCAYNYILSDLYNDQGFMLLSSSISRIPPSVYRKNFYCSMKNLFNDFFENRISQICKDNKLFENLDKCLSEFNLLLSKKDYSSYLLKLFLSNRDTSIILKEKISTDKVTLKDLRNEILNNNEFNKELSDNIKGEKSVDLLTSLLRKKYTRMKSSIIDDYLKNVDVNAEIINPIKIKLLKSKSTTLFDLLIEVSNKLLSNVDKYVNQNKLFEPSQGMSQDILEKDDEDDKKDSKDSKESKDKEDEKKESDIPMKDKRCGNVLGMVFCKDTGKCFGPWKDTCKNMSIDNATKQKFERANQLFNSVMDSKGTPSAKQLDQLNSLLGKKNEWDNQYKITRDMWLKNSGKCYFSKLNLIKNKDNSYTLFWKRVDANEDGNPKTFKTLEHFNKFWDFVNKNVESINSCKNPYDSHKSVNELHDKIKKMERDRYLAKEVEEDVQDKINKGEVNKTKSLNEKCSSGDLKSAIEKLERRIIGLETALTNNRKISGEEYKKLLEEHKKAVEKYHKLIEELKRKLKKSNQEIKSLNFEHQIELEKANKAKKCDFGPYGYYYLPPNNWKVPQPKHEVCISEKKCAVCPLYTENNPTSYMNKDLWDNHVYLANPDKIVPDEKEKKEKNNEKKENNKKDEKKEKKENNKKDENKKDSK